MCSGTEAQLSTLGICKPLQQHPSDRSHQALSLPFSSLQLPVYCDSSKGGSTRESSSSRISTFTVLTQKKARRLDQHGQEPKLNFPYWESSHLNSLHAEKDWDFNLACHRLTSKSQVTDYFNQSSIGKI